MLQNGIIQKGTFTKRYTDSIAQSEFQLKLESTRSLQKKQIKVEGSLFNFSFLGPRQFGCTFRVLSKKDMKAFTNYSLEVHIRGHHRPFLNS
jgi:hypothetical protein